MRLNVFQEGREIVEDGDIVPHPEMFVSRQYLHFQVKSQSEDNGFDEYEVKVGKKWNEINCGCYFGVSHGQKSKTLMSQDTGGICKHAAAAVIYISRRAEALEKMAEEEEISARMN